MRIPNKDPGILSQVPILTLEDGAGGVPTWMFGSRSLRDTHERQTCRVSGLGVEGFRGLGFRGLGLRGFRGRGSELLN